jgi:hypothetical protein
MTNRPSCRLAVRLLPDPVSGSWDRLGPGTGPPERRARTGGIPECSAIRTWNAIRHPDGAERAVRSEQFRNNLQSHDWPIRQADLACSPLVMNSHFSLFMYPM